jgi:hypothetical protein
VNDQNSRHARLRYTVTGALAALAAVGAIAGAAALAANPSAKTHGHAAAASGLTTKTPASSVPDKTHAPQPAVNQQPFFTAIQQLVDNGTLSATEGQAVDREIQQGYLDTSTLTGFTQAQLQAVQQALKNTKRALAPAATGAPGTPKSPPPGGTGAPSGGKAPPPAAPGNNGTPK